MKYFDEELTQIRKEIVDFHGEMVLLENYSALNYTGNRTVPLVTGIIYFCFILSCTLFGSLHFVHGPLFTNL